jgi:hypothetical protein
LTPKTVSTELELEGPSFRDPKVPPASKKTVSKGAANTAK